MTVIKKTTASPIAEVWDGRTPSEMPPNKIPTAYRTCPLCKEVYAQAIGGLWRKIILDGNQVWVCAGCERRLTKLVEG